MSDLPDGLLARLDAVLGPRGLLPGDAVATWRAPAWPGAAPRAALAIARPASVGEAAAVLRLCSEARQPVVTVGGQTGLVHGADSGPGDLVLSLERMARIREVDPQQRTMIAEAGVTVQAVQEAAAAAGLFYPVDFGARGSATLGGSLATNAGGNRVIRWGMTRDRVLGVEAALADGTELHGLSTLMKNNTGYDLRHLLVGSEGTLGVLTAAALRLAEAPVSQCAAFAAVPDFQALTGFLRHIDRSLGGLLTAFEVLWPEAYAVLTTPPAPHRPPVPHGAPFTVLVEAMGGDAASDTARFAQTLERALEAGLITDAAVAQSGADIARFWAIRDDVLQFAQHWPIQTFDVSLPLKHMEAYVAEVRRRLAARFGAPRLFVFGHLGDGNLHLIAAPGAEDPASRQAVEAAVYEPLQPIRGSVSAEHGIGLEKRAYLALSRTPDELRLMQRLKAVFDPAGILNPGRLFAPDPA